jgi:ferritin-like metal-binding protein YciE
VEVSVARDRNEAINSYITDMLSLEDHIGKALKSQLSDLKDYPDVVAELRLVHQKIEHHISDLRALSERRKAGGVTESVKRAGSAVAGMAAGLVDLVRTEGLPKNLRDDYTAFNLATIGYVMLHTTALALGEQEVAELAHQHLRDYAAAALRLDRVIPAAVVRYLQEEGLPAQDVAHQVGRTVEEAWEQNVESGTSEPVSARRP